METEPVLHDITVLDFTWVLAGPYATRLLADFGAEVVKVQPRNIPAESDDAFAGAYEATWNRNKRSITLDLDKPEGVALAKRLVGISDVVIENFTPRVMANWGLDYERLKAVRPDIIMVSLSALGHTGPRRDEAGFAPTVHAASGLTGLTRFRDGPPPGPGFSYADHVAGLYAAMAVLGALEHRRQTGEGRYIDISQTEAVMSLLGDAFLAYQMTGREPEPSEPGEITRRLRDEDIELQDAAALYRDPLLRERGFFMEKPETGLPDASPIRLSATPARYRNDAPAAGQDSEYVLRDLLGMEQEEIDRLRQAEII